MSRRSVASLSAIIAFAACAFAQTPQPSQPVLNRSFMDRTIDPCVDFFQYSCGGWIKNNPIPPDQSSWSIYSQVSEANKVQLRGILEAAAVDPKSSPTNLKIGDYYSSCMDLKAIEDAGMKPLQSELDHINQLSSKSEIADVAVLL